MYVFLNEGFHCIIKLLFVVMFKNDFSENVPWQETEEERQLWQEEQKRLDREWYAMDEGYDDTHNPFADTSEEYARKKEQELEKKKKKKMSARQRQINKVRN